MAFPELPDDRRARPRRYRGSDPPERGGRRRAPEDPPPAAEAGVDEQDWLLGAALQHGVPVREDGSEDADPAARGLQTRHAADDDGPDVDRGRHGWAPGPDRNGHDGHGGYPAPNGNGAHNGSGGFADGPDSLRARYAERLRDTYSYDTGGPDAAPARRRPDGADPSWPPAGRRGRPDDAAPRGSHRIDPGAGPDPYRPAPPNGRPADGYGAGTEGGRHGAAGDPAGRHTGGAPRAPGRRDDGRPGDPAGSPMPRGYAAGAPRRDRPGPPAGPPPHRPGPDVPGPPHHPGPPPEVAGPPNRPGPPGIAGPPHHPGPPPRPRGRPGPPEGHPAEPGPAPTRPAGRADAPPERPVDPAGRPDGDLAPERRSHAAGAHRDAAQRDRTYRDGTHRDGTHRDGTHRDGAHRDGAHRNGAPAHRPDGSRVPRGPVPPETAAAAAPGRPATRPPGADGRVSDDVRTRRAPLPPDEPHEGPDPSGGPPATAPVRRRPPARPTPDGPPAEDGAPDTGGPPAGEAAPDTDGPRAGKRSGPVGIAGRLAALTGRGGSGEKRQMSFWKELPLLIGVALLLTFLIQTFLAKVYVIPSGSMETTLHGCTGCNNDRVLVDKVTYNFSDIEPGDVVVFKGPDSWSNEEYAGEPSGNPLVRGLEMAGSLIGFAPPNEKDFVKRVIATGGQTVACCDALNQVMVDGQPLEEPYVYYLPEAGPARQIPFGPVTVPEGELWMMGDSRNNSADSRATGHGPVPEENVIGKVRLIVLPLDRFGWVDSVNPQVTADAAGSPGLPVGLPLALGIMGTLPLAAGRRRVLLARAEAERFLPATRPPNGWRRRA